MLAQNRRLSKKLGVLNEDVVYLQWLKEIKLFYFILFAPIVKTSKCLQTSRLLIRNTKQILIITIVYPAWAPCSTSRWLCKVVATHHQDNLPVGTVLHHCNHSCGNKVEQNERRVEVHLFLSSYWEMF